MSQVLERLIDELVLVYDADSGFLAAVLDSVKKVFSVSGCSLCDITHGVFGAKKKWVEFAGALAVPVRGFHRDDLSDPLRQLCQNALPCVLVRSGDHSHVLLDRDSINGLGGSVPEFLERLLTEAHRQGWVFPSGQAKTSDASL